MGASASGCWGLPSPAHLWANTELLSRDPAGSALRRHPSRCSVAPTGVAITLTYLRGSQHHFVPVLTSPFSCLLWLGVNVHVYAYVHVRAFFTPRFSIGLSSCAHGDHIPVGTAEVSVGPSCA